MTKEVPSDIVPVGFISNPTKILQGIRKGDLQDKLKKCGLRTRGNKRELFKGTKKAIEDKVLIQKEVMHEVAI